MDGVLKANALEPLKVDLGGGAEQTYMFIWTHTHACKTVPQEEPESATKLGSCQRELYKLSNPSPDVEAEPKLKPWSLNPNPTAILK